MWRRGPQAAAAQKRPSTFGRSSSSSKQEPIHILICSANLGNAQPDDASLQAWIPKDGRLFTPQENEHQKYPLATTVESSSSPSSPSTNKNNKIGSASSPTSLPQSSLFLSHNHESSGDFSLAPEDLPDRSFLQKETSKSVFSNNGDRQTTPSTTASSTGLLLPHTSMEEQDDNDSSSSSSSDESLLRWQQEQRRLQRRQWAEEQRRSNLKSTLLVTRKSQDEQDDRPLSTLMVHEYIAPSGTPPSRTGSKEVAAPHDKKNLEEDDVLPFRKDIVPRKTGVQSLQESDRLTGDLKDWASPAKEEQLLNRKVSLVDDEQDHEDEDTNDAATLKSPSFAESVGAFIAQSEALIRATSVDEEEDDDDQNVESKKKAPLSLPIPKPQVVEDPEEPPSLSLTKAAPPPMERPPPRAAATASTLARISMTGQIQTSKSDWDWDHPSDEETVASWRSSSNHSGTPILPQGATLPNLLGAHNDSSNSDISSDSSPSVIWNPKRRNVTKIRATPEDDDRAAEPSTVVSDDDSASSPSVVWNPKQRNVTKIRALTEEQQEKAEPSSVVSDSSQTDDDDSTSSPSVVWNPKQRNVTKIRPTSDHNDDQEAAPSSVVSASTSTGSDADTDSSHATSSSASVVRNPRQRNLAKIRVFDDKDDSSMSSSSIKGSWSSDVSSSSSETSLSAQMDQFDIIVLGLQESTFTTIEEQEMAKFQKVNKQIRELTATKNHAPDAGDTTNHNADPDTILLHQQLQEHLPSYEKKVSFQRGQMRLEVFLSKRSTRITSIEVLSVQAHNTGRAGLANKGGIVAELLVNNTTRVAVVTCHLEAHEGKSKYKARCSSLTNILREIPSHSTACPADIAMTNHFCFLMGDLNFRTNLSSKGPFEQGSKPHIQWAHQLTAGKRYETLNKADELASALRHQDCLVGFNTMPCIFPPTFKVERASGYKYNEKRSPSYTDRILYKTSHQLQERLKCIRYEPIDEFATSDHKPIRGAFTIELNSRLKWRPSLLSKSANFLQNMMAVARNNASASRKKKKGPETLLKTKSRTSKFLSPSPTLNSMATPQVLNLFISQIAVGIDRKEYKPLPSFLDTSPDPSTFVSFITNPSDATRSPRSAWKLMTNCLSCSSADAAAGPARSVRGWPRTMTINHTFTPQWKQDEEVMITVKTHHDDGMPIDLSGAMLHILVMDAKNQRKSLRSQPRIVGSFTLNLAHVIDRTRKLAPPGTRRTSSNRGLRVSNHSRGGMRSSSHSRGSDAMDPNQSQETGDITAGPSDQLRSTLHTSMFSGHARKAAHASLMEKRNQEKQPGGNNRGSTRSLLGMGNSDHGAPRRGSLIGSRRASIRNLTRMASNREIGDELDNLNIHSMTISEPILKNGKSMGHILFTIDAWWVRDSFGPPAGATGEGTNKHRPSRSFGGVFGWRGASNEDIPES